MPRLTRGLVDGVNRLGPDRRRQEAGLQERYPHHGESRSGVAGGAGSITPFLLACHWVRPVRSLEQGIPGRPRVGFDALEPTMTLLDRVRFSALYLAFACLCVQVLARPDGSEAAMCGAWAVAVASSTVAMDIIKEFLSDRRGD
jgi:hypothetical protein